jgi:hypothetical protein
LFGGHEFAAQKLRLTSLLLDDASGIYARWAIEHQGDAPLG